MKKTALTQSHKEEEYRVAISECSALKKEKKRWCKTEQEYIRKVEELQNSTKQDFMERATRDAELYNLKNAVARIPQDIWNTYTKSKSQNREH